jgi:hypothetical protein
LGGILNLYRRVVLAFPASYKMRRAMHVWCHGLRHSSITAALYVAGKAGIGLDKVKATSRHRAIGTLLNGLDRCRYHGDDGMHRWVGFGVIADNLINIATFGTARAAA